LLSIRYGTDMNNTLLESLAPAVNCFCSCRKRLDSFYGREPYKD